jgi:hypothetical protein
MRSRPGLIEAMTPEIYRSATEQRGLGQTFDMIIAVATGRTKEPATNLQVSFPCLVRAWRERRGCQAFS